jgi:GntR family uxuAB operon transcriptional repressor
MPNTVLKVGLVQQAVDRGTTTTGSGVRMRQEQMTSSAATPRTSGPPPPRPAAYSQDLAGLILARAMSADDGAGGRLPTERALVAELGVTRTMVRHALAVLEAEGRISREVGRGTFLRTASPSPGRTAQLAGATAEVGPADVMAARRVIEPQVLPLVVAWATQRDFDELRRCLEGGAAAENFAEFERWDFALHHAIVAASRNELLLSMYGAVERAREGAMWGNLKRRNDSRERRAAYQADHLELVEAVCARELDHAVAAMNAHLARVEVNLLETGPPRGSG